MATKQISAAKPRRILVVEDSPEFCILLEHTLASDGYDVTIAKTGGDALREARDSAPDLVLLDLVLPDMGGLEVCRELRTFSDAYVVILTAKDDEVDKIVGLSLGADDYVTKPFSPKELLARVAAMFRRPRAQDEQVSDAAGDVLRHDDLLVDLGAHEASLEGAVLPLTRIEFQLLATLLGRPKITFTRAMLREQVWGDDWYGDDHVVDVHIANLRKKIDSGREASRIKTVRGVGYRFAV